MYAPPDGATAGYRAAARKGPPVGHLPGDRGAPSSIFGDGTQPLRCLL